MAEDAEPAGLLDGVRVLDLTTAIAGPSATRLLADHGAEVIKIESQRHLDSSRFGPPFAAAGPDGRAAAGRPGPDASVYFATYNTNKQSMRLDLRNPAGKAIFRRLVERSDVVVEAFTPGVMDGLGLGWETLSAWNRRLILASHSLSGQDGRRCGQRGYGQLASAMAGWVDLTGRGRPGEPPCGPYSAYTDFLSWPFLAAAILLALEVRETTGEGLRIDHSHLESSAYLLAPELSTAGEGPSPARQVDAVLATAGHDQWCTITATTDEAIAALTAMVGAGEEADGIGDLAAAVADREVDSLVDELCACGVAAARVVNPSELFDDPQLAARGFFGEVDHPVIGRHRVHGAAFVLDGIAAPAPPRPAPRLGEHTAWVCRDVLGMSDEEVAVAAAGGALW